MELEGKIWKNKNFWLVEIPSLDVMTQARTRKDALLMIKDLVEVMIDLYFEKSITINVTDYKKGVIGISSKEEKDLFSLVLKRQNE